MTQFKDLCPAMQSLVRESVQEAVDAYDGAIDAVDFDGVALKELKKHALIAFGLKLTPGGPMYYVPDFLVQLVDDYVNENLVVSLALN
jgi:hypothetical protein